MGWLEENKVIYELPLPSASREDSGNGKDVSWSAIFMGRYYSRRC